MKKITVMAVGSGAMHTLNHLSEKNIENAELICVNSDKEILERAKTQKLLIGEILVDGLGCAGNAEKGKTCARMYKEEIQNKIKDTDLLFLVICLGGGCGTGAGVIIGEIAKELGIKTYALVTYPFSFEGRKRNEQALRGYSELLPVVDEVFAMHNDDILSKVDRRTTMSEAFKAMDTVISEKFLEIYRNEMREEE